MEVAKHAKKEHGLIQFWEIAFRLLHVQNVKYYHLIKSNVSLVETIQELKKIMYVALIHALQDRSLQFWASVKTVQLELHQMLSWEIA